MKLLSAWTAVALLSTTGPGFAEAPARKETSKAAPKKGVAKGGAFAKDAAADFSLTGEKSAPAKAASPADDGAARGMTKTERKAAPAASDAARRKLPFDDGSKAKGSTPPRPAR
jgi:hypothetical protein